MGSFQFFIFDGTAISQVRHRIWVKQLDSRYRAFNNNRAEKVGTISYRIVMKIGEQHGLFRVIPRS